MIRKYIIIGRSIFIQNNIKDSPEENVRPIEILLPVDELSQLNKLLSHIDYLSSSQEPKGDIDAVKNAVLAFIQPYAVSEKDRLWLLSKIARTDEL